MLMAKNEGIRGMFRGNWTNCIRIIPNSAIKFLTYEQLTRCVHECAVGVCVLLVLVRHIHEATRT